MSESSLTPERIYGKILLFGEYTILMGGNALAIPLQNKSFSGELIFETPETQNSAWRQWLKYLLELRHTKLNAIEFDWDRFEKEITAGLSFTSTIPHGYGLGSSGALTAAVFKRYISEDQWTSFQTEPSRLQKTLALFESFFHGSSSGLDPLVSLLSTPIHVTGSTTSQLPKLGPGTCQNWFLVDSGVPRQTSQLVETFRKKVASDLHFENKMQELKTANHQSIKDFLEQKSGSIRASIQQISNIQYTWMNWLIPDTIKASWAEGLESDRFYFKLCGAGGGGFFLVNIPSKADQLRLNEKMDLINIDAANQLR